MDYEYLVELVIWVTAPFLAIGMVGAASLVFTGKQNINISYFGTALLLAVLYFVFRPHCGCVEFGSRVMGSFEAAYLVSVPSMLLCWLLNAIAAKFQKMNSMRIRPRN
jgi:hypothetical protein